MSENNNYCRMCLSVDNLNPIFMKQDQDTKYSKVILETTGIKIDKDDAHSQQICVNCTIFINKSFKFRQSCWYTQQLLEKNIQNLQIKKTDSNPSSDIEFEIDISHVNGDFDDTTDVKCKIEDNSSDDSWAKLEIVESDFEEEFSTSIQKCKTLKMTSTKKDVTKVLHMIPKKISNNEDRIKILHLVPDELTSNTTENVYQCDMCPKIFKSKFSLRDHLLMHTGYQFICEHCGKKFITNSKLSMHAKSKHGYEKTDQCKYCDYKGCSAEQVKNHERLHTGEKPFACTQCEARFSRRSSYLQHVAIHLPDKTVQCDQCPARFKSVTLMRIHKYRHRTADYVYKCYVCDGSFARKRNVVRHLQRIHAVCDPDLSKIQTIKSNKSDEK